MKNNYNQVMMNVFKIFFLILFIAILNIEKVEAIENKNSILVEKISKDYTNKYCNSIAFGLSKESAMKFSMEENKKVFEKRKGINNIDKDYLTEEIATSVVEKCGYLINLYGEEGIKEFTNFYLAEERE